MGSFDPTILNSDFVLNTSVTKNVYIKLPKNNFAWKITFLTPLQKLPNNVGDLGKINVATGFEKLLKV